MPVVSVKEDWQELAVSLGQESASATRKFTVLFDAADEPSTRPLLALSADDGTTRIPYRWERHPQSSWLFVSNMATKIIGPFYFEVIVEYTTRSLEKRNEAYEPDADPLNQPWEIEWTYAAHDEVIDKDINGKRITNSAYEPYSGITKTFYDLVLRISRPLSLFDPLMVKQYIDSVNSDVFLGFEPGVALCLDFSGRRARSADLFYWIVNYQFQFREAGWGLELQDEGFIEWDEESGAYRKITIKTERIDETTGLGTGKFDAESVTEPWPLNGSGGAIPQSVLHSGEATMYKRKFEMRMSKPFSVLELE